MNRYTKTKSIIFWVIMSVLLTMSLTATILSSVLLVKLADTEKYIRSHSCADAVIVNTKDTDTPNDTEAQRLYVLGVKDGMLTVYAADGATVVEILQTYIYSLPEADREALSQGISVYSVNELSSLIQDYTS